jgi:hypothetical protein
MSQTSLFEGRFEGANNVFLSHHFVKGLRAVLASKDKISHGFNFTARILSC